MRFALLTAIFAVALGLNSGCQSISDSVTSPSRWLGDSSKAIGDSSDASADSSNAFSKSSSGSSSGDDEEEPESESRYRQDVRVAARSWGASDATSYEFSRELGRVAARHGVVDWQARPSTFQEVGVGLREAGLSPAEVDSRLGDLGAQAAIAAGSPTTP